jgi:hypothetical protein
MFLNSSNESDSVIKAGQESLWPVDECGILPLASDHLHIHISGLNMLWKEIEEMPFNIKLLFCH